MAENDRAYQEWCRDAMLPRHLGYGEQWQTWYEGRIYSPPREGWDADEPVLWLPQSKGSRSLPTNRDGIREVWVPTEADWLDWLTTAGYSVSIGARTHEDRFPVGLVQQRQVTGTVAVNAVSWAHGMALCWAQTPEGRKHFGRLEACRG